jgi:hypothetical protein
MLALQAFFASPSEIESEDTMEKLIEDIIKLSQTIQEVAGLRLADSPFGKTMGITKHQYTNDDGTIISGYLVEFDGLKEKGPTIETALTTIRNALKDHAVGCIRTANDRIKKLEEALR